MVWNWGDQDVGQWWKGKGYGVHNPRTPHFRDQLKSQRTDHRLKTPEASANPSSSPGLAWQEAQWGTVWSWSVHPPINPPRGPRPLASS